MTAVQDFRKRTPLAQLVRNSRRMPSGCIEWTGYRTAAGYGVVERSGRNHYAHRFAYTVIVGEIPDGQELHHVCLNTSCILPGHLELVSKRQHPRLHRLTYCKRGHAMTDENIYVRPDNGHRLCRACDRLRQQERPRRASHQKKAA